MALESGDKETHISRTMLLMGTAIFCVTARGALIHSHTYFCLENSPYEDFFQKREKHTGRVLTLFGRSLWGFARGDLILGPHGDTSPHESVCIQVEVLTRIEKQEHTHTLTSHTHTHTQSTFTSKSILQPRKSSPCERTPAACALWLVTLLYATWWRFDLQTQTLRLLLIHENRSILISRFPALSVLLSPSLSLSCSFAFSFALVWVWDVFVVHSQIYCIENAHGQLVRDLDFNPNKQYYLASCGDDCKVKFWDVRHINEPVKCLEEHSHWSDTEIHSNTAQEIWKWTHTTSQILKDAIIMFLKDVSSAYFFIKNIVKTLKIKWYIFTL